MAGEQDARDEPPARTP